MNLHQGKIEDAVVRAVIQDDDGTKLQVDVVGLDLTALIDTRQVVEFEGTACSPSRLGFLLDFPRSQSTIVVLLGVPDRRILLE